jgi:hypothetical protein
MKRLVFLLSLLFAGQVTLLAQSTNASCEKKFYLLRDYLYFKPALADIRRPTFSMRFYYDEAVKYSDLTVTSGKHKFWDVAFGGSFPMLGYKRQDPLNNNRMQTVGAALFIDASACMLLDFDTPSADVINTDFRLGAGIAARPFSPVKNLALRLKAFHESTHIGDEYTLTAEAQAAFRRYNVSYEAVELFLAYDYYHQPSQNSWDFAYARLYGGGRWLNSSVYEDFRDPSPARALRTKDKNEAQYGGEFFLRGSSLISGEDCSSWSFFKNIVKPQYLVLAADFYRRDKYDVIAPIKTWSYNIVAGLVYGDYFGDARTTKLLLNYYHGVNPHGQLRMDEISYLGISYRLDF